MGRKKDSMGLFEVLSKGHGEMGVPDWVKRKPAPPDEPKPDEPRPDEPTDGVSQETPEPSAPSAPPPPMPKATVVESDEDVEADEAAVENAPLLAQAESSTTEDEDVDENDEETSADRAEDETGEDVEEDDEPDEETEETTEEPDASVDETDDETEPDDEEIEDVEADEPAAASPPPVTAATPIQTDGEANSSTLPAWARPRSREEQTRPPVPSAEPVDEPLLKVVGDQVRIAIGFVSAMLVLGGVLVVLVLSFVVGRLTGPTTDVADAPSGEAAPKAGLPINVRERRPADTPVVAEPETRDARRFYLIVQQLNGKTGPDYDEAVRIRDYCKAHEIPAELVLANGRFAVWSLVGFRSTRSSEAIEHAKRIEALGGEYFKKHKTWKFEQRKDGKFHPQYVRGQAVTSGKG